MQAMKNFLKEHETKLRIKITFSIETETLGTAGPFAFARDQLVDGSGEPFFVLNGDVFCEYPFKKMIKFHQSHGGEASIVIAKVKLQLHIPFGFIFIFCFDGWNLLVRVDVILLVIPKCYVGYSKILDNIFRPDF